MRETGKTMRRLLPDCVLDAMLGLAACDNGTELERAGVYDLAGCFAGAVIKDGIRLLGVAQGPIAAAFADDV